MKVKELMIGDWVQNPLGWKARVMSIRYINVIKDEWEYLFKIGISEDTYQYNLSESDLLPIPLTSEILEKNGFTDVVNPPYKERVLHHVIDGYCVKINVVNKDANMIITPLAERTLVRRRADFILPNPDYVHELQHAMRICGILKEIEL